MTAHMWTQPPEHEPIMPARLPTLTHVECRICHCYIGYVQSLTPAPVVCHECVRSGRYRREG